MFKLGLTGSIATGKSTVLQIFAGHAVPTFSSDAAVHDLYRGAAVAPVEALFPGVAKGGVIDRTELSRRLLDAPARILELEAVVHPLVRRRIADFIAGAEASGAPLAVVDIPLLYENGVDYGLDAVAVTVCSAETQRRRALARPGMTGEKLDGILARQTPQAEKKARAAYVFDTDQPLENTAEAVSALVETLSGRRPGKA